MAVSTPSGLSTSVTTLRPFIRRLPGARLLRRGFAAGGKRGGSLVAFATERVRPMPVPRYVGGVASCGDSFPFVRPTAPALAEAALAGETARSVADVLDRLTSGEGLAELPRLQAFYRDGVSKFGGHWRYADLLTTLRAAASLIRPANYLEIGVLRGRSAAVVGATCPESAIYGFDLWWPEYAGMANPGPDFARSELRAAGHRGQVVLVPGDSKKTVPAFLREHPDLYFDLITIDGGKSVREAAIDFANTLPRLKAGGVVVFDDLALFPSVRRVWNQVIRRDSRYVSWEFKDGPVGVAAAIRLPDEEVAMLPEKPR